MIIRPATEGDLERVTRLSRGALSFALPPEPGFWDRAPEEQVLSRLRAHLPGDRGVALIAEVNDEIAGYIGCLFEPPDISDSRKRAVVDLLAVGSRYRGHGIGTQLVTEMRAALSERGVPSMDVEAESANDAAVRFWRRAGFHNLAVKMTVETR